MYSLYLYFLGLSLSNLFNAGEPFKYQQRSNDALWDGWDLVLFKSMINLGISAFILDETLFKLLFNIFGYGSV